MFEVSPYLLLFLGGLAGGASFGPINLAVLQLYMEGTPKFGLAFSLGAVIGDTSLVLFNAFASEALIFHLPERWLLIGGGFLLLFFSVYTTSSATRAQSHPRSSKFAHSQREGFLYYFLFGLFLTVFSPFGIALWASLVLSSRGELTMGPVVLFMGSGSICWFVFFNSILFMFADFFKEPIRRLVSIVSSGIIFALGGVAVVKGVSL